MAVPTIPINQSPIQKIAQDRAARTCKLSPSDEALRGQVKSFRECLFDLWSKTLHWPVMGGKNLRNLDTNTGPVLGLKERFKQRLPHLLTDFGNRINRSDPDVIIIVGQELSKNGCDLGRDMASHRPN